MQSRGSVAALRVADLTIDALRPVVLQAGREIQLSPTEHRLLYQLAGRPGTVIAHRDFADALGRDVRSSNMLARHIACLRRKLCDNVLNPRYIKTVVGIGYCFVRPL